jgi:hypothetical protein
MLTRVHELADGPATVTETTQHRVGARRKPGSAGEHAGRASG